MPEAGRGAGRINVYKHLTHWELASASSFGAAPWKHLRKVTVFQRSFVVVVVVVDSSGTRPLIPSLSGLRRGLKGKEKKFNYFINKHLLSTYCVPGPVLDA